MSRNWASAQAMSAIVWPGSGSGMEGHEIDRMAVAQRDPDLARLLHAADPGPMAGARVDDHERPLLRVGSDAPLGLDAQQHVVDRPLELAPVHDQLVVEHQHRRLALAVVLERLVAALAQHVPEQDLALRRIDPIVQGFLCPAAAGPTGSRSRRFVRCRRHHLCGLAQPPHRRLGKAGKRRGHRRPGRALGRRLQRRLVGMAVARAGRDLAIPKPVTARGSAAGPGPAGSTVSGRHDRLLRAEMVSLRAEIVAIRAPSWRCCGAA